MNQTNSQGTDQSMECYSSSRHGQSTLCTEEETQIVLLFANHIYSFDICLYNYNRERFFFYLFVPSKSRENYDLIPSQIPNFYPRKHNLSVRPTCTPLSPSSFFSDLLIFIGIAELQREETFSLLIHFPKGHSG